MEVVDDPLFYDNHLVTHVKQFQHRNQLPESGIAGPNTMAQLKKIAMTIKSPHLKIVE